MIPNLYLSHSHFSSPPLEPPPSTRSWRSASAITTTPSYSPSERLTVTASRRSSSSRSRSSKHSALNWRMRAKPCWVSSPFFPRDLFGPFFWRFCCLLYALSSQTADAESGLSPVRSKTITLTQCKTCFEIWMSFFLQTWGYLGSSCDTKVKLWQACALFQSNNEKSKDERGPSWAPSSSLVTMRTCKRRFSLTVLSPSRFEGGTLCNLFIHEDHSYWIKSTFWLHVAQSVILRSSWVLACICTSTTTL